MVESAGGVSVQFHILSPASRGLFHKAISQSGTAINFFSKNTPAEVRRQSKNFAEKFSCPSDDSRKMVECLKRLDAGDIVRAHRENVVLNQNDPQYSVQRRIMSSNFIHIP